MAISEHTRQAAEELSEAVRFVAGVSAAVTLLQSEDGASLKPAGHSRLATGSWTPGDSELVEPATGNGPGAHALELGVTLVYSTEDIPQRSLPNWVTSRGFTTAIVIPLIKHGAPFGAVYAVRRDPQPPSTMELHLAELAVAHGGRALPVLVKRHPPDDEDDVAGFTMAATEAVRDLKPLRFVGLQLDPLREQVQLGEVAVSLSRTEFMMLYTLGQQVNEIVPHHVLLEACWQEDIPALSAVDATVYRLRKKLSTAEAKTGRQMVKTIRGKGYLLVAAPQGIASSS